MSPDGVTVAYLGSDQGLVVARIDSGQQRVVAKKVELYPLSTGSLGWNEDGSITYVEEVSSGLLRGGLVCLTYPCPEVFRLDLTTGKRSSISAGPDVYFMVILETPAVCPDPRRLREVIDRFVPLNPPLEPTPREVLEAPN